MRAALILTGLLVASLSPLRPGEVERVAPASQAETCEQRSRRLFGLAPTRVGGQVKEPKRLHHVKPDYPEVPAGTVASGLWIGEALIGPDGRVRSVDVLRDLILSPPLPQYSKAISDAILQWRYAPTAIDGKPATVCVVITVGH